MASALVSVHTHFGGHTDPFPDPLVVKLACSAPELVARGSGQTLIWANKLQHDLLRRFSPHAVSGRTLLQEAEERLCIFPFGKVSMLKFSTMPTCGDGAQDTAGDALYVLCLLLCVMY